MTDKEKIARLRAALIPLADVMFEMAHNSFHVPNGGELFAREWERNDPDGYRMWLAAREVLATIKR